MGATLSKENQHEMKVITRTTNHTLIFTLCVFVILNILDIVTTNYVLAFGGSETNLLLKATGSYWPVVKGSIAIVFVAVAYFLQHKPLMVRIAEKLTIAMFLVVCFNEMSVGIICVERLISALL